MTVGGPPVGRSPWPVAAWAMTGFTLMALVVGIAGNVLSRTAVLDAIALWPIAALAVPAALIGLKGGRHRALAPLMLISWMLITFGLHLGGFEGLPSTAAAVTTDLSGSDAVRLTVSVDDLALKIGQGSFEVSPSPVGGQAGVPVIERVSGTTATALVVTDDPDRSPWFRFGEYRISLDSGIAWDLRIRVGGLDADVSEVDVAGARFEASTGRVALGAPSAPTTVEIAGNIEVSVPAGVAVTVAGTTRVPSDWIVDGEGATAPVDGDGWTIRVLSGSVRIVSR